MKLMDIVCKYIGHNWTGYTSSITGLKLRACRRCKKVQQYINKGMGGLLTGFVDMNKLKKAGYIKYIKELE